MCHLFDGRGCEGAGGLPHRHTRPQLTRVVSVNTPRVAQSFIHSIEI
jgi:hypothetical protein